MIISSQRNIGTKSDCLSTIIFYHFLRIIENIYLDFNAYSLF